MAHQPFKIESWKENISNADARCIYSVIFYVHGYYRILLYIFDMYTSKIFACEKKVARSRSDELKKLSVCHDF
jgi:hypothetical protein